MNAFFIVDVAENDVGAVSVKEFDGCAANAACAAFLSGKLFERGVPVTMATLCWRDVSRDSSKWSSVMVVSR